jgi:hypothetical protein
MLEEAGLLHNGTLASRFGLVYWMLEVPMLQDLDW